MTKKTAPQEGSDFKFTLTYITRFERPCEVVTRDGISKPKNVIHRMLSKEKVPFATTLDDLAKAAGLSRYVVGNNLRKLRAEGVVDYLTLSGKKYVYVVEKVEACPQVCHYSGKVCGLNSCLFLRMCSVKNASISGGKE